LKSLFHDSHFVCLSAFSAYFAYQMWLLQKHNNLSLLQNNLINIADFKFSLWFVEVH